MLHRIVIIDENIHCKAAEKMISSLMHQKNVIVEYMSEPQKTWRLLEANPLRFSLCIADLGTSRDSFEATISALEKLTDINPYLEVIFTSSQPQLYYDMYSVDHLFLLKKPLKPEYLKKALVKYEKQRSLKAGVCDRKFVASNFTETYVLNADSIYYVRKARRGVIITTDRGEYEHSGSLEDFTDSTGGHFVRCHNSHVVNFCHAMELRKETLLLDNEELLTVSRAYYKSVKEYAERLGLMLLKKQKEKTQ